MRGIVFTELIDLIEDKYGYEVVDMVLQQVKPESGGSYTSVGAYPFRELLALVVKLSEELEVSVETLLEIYGHHLFSVFAKKYAAIFVPDIDALTFLASVEDHIHPQVLKLYPDAELPSFDIVKKNDDQLIMVYRSNRKMGIFARGLIKGCLEYFGENGEIHMENLNEDGTEVRFTVTRRP